MTRNIVCEPCYTPPRLDFDEPNLHRAGDALATYRCDFCNRMIKPGDRIVAEAYGPRGSHVDLDWASEFVTEPAPRKFDLADFQARRRAAR